MKSVPSERVRVKSGAAVPGDAVDVEVVVDVGAVVEVESGLDVVGGGAVSSVVEVVSIVDDTPHDATRTAHATIARICLVTPTVYDSSAFALAGVAHADKCEVLAPYFGEPMGGGELAEHRGHLIEGNVDGGATPLAHEMLVVTLSCEVNDRGPVAEMDMMENAEALEHVERSVDGRLVDTDTRCGFGPFLQLGRVEVLSNVGGERLADRASCSGDSKAFGAKVGDECVDVDHGARKDGMPVIAFPRIRV